MSMVPARENTTVITNHFAITRPPQATFHLYQGAYIGSDYDTLPDPPRSRNGSPDKKRAFIIMDQVQSEHVRQFTPNGMFDGAQQLYSLRKDLANTYTTAIGHSQYQVELRLIDSLPPDKLRQSKSRLLNVLQMIVKQAPQRRHLVTRGNSFYKVTNPEESKLPGGLVHLHGWFQSVRPAINKLLVNVNISNAVAYRHGPLIDLGIEFFMGMGKKVPDIRDLQRISEVDAQKLTRYVTNVKVTVNVAGVKKPKAIKKVVLRAGKFEFDKDGQLTTVAQHLWSKYNQTTRFPDLFGVRLGNSKDGPVYPAEFCDVVPGQFFRKQLSPDQQAEFIRRAARNPSTQLRDIIDAIAGVPGKQVFDYADSAYLKDVGMTISTTPMSLQGSIIKPPPIHFGSTGEVTPAQGRWNVTGAKLQLPAAPIKSRWALVNFDPTSSPRDMSKFVERLVTNLQKRGIDIVKIEPMLGNSTDVETSLRMAAQRFARPGPAPDQPLFPIFFLIVLPSSAATVKQQVKHFLTVTRSIPTQCIRGGKWNSRKNMSSDNALDQYCNNLALKINVKLGGVNSTVPLLNKYLINTMVVGCDVSHPAPGERGKPSIASLVASVNETASYYTSQVSLQEPRVEIISNLDKMLQVAINDYRQFVTKGDNRPFALNHVIVFRDGVSEGEHQQVQEQEVQMIDKLLMDFSKTFKQPRVALTYLIVTKRHHVRFFPQHILNAASTSGNQAANENCGAGLVIDDNIVQNKNHDFFLLSHQGLIGTSRPAHYFVLRNDMNASISALENVAYYLCHVYASATRSVSIPAPVYYADLACANANYHFNKAEADRLQEASTVNSDHAEPFDLRLWQNAFTRAGDATRRSLYFI
ncbi:Piwi-domain-containing protein [Panus rudis PR-1116 ss-1]|nr:Piwi-domain-containing protein [Panus rudis PR-1116 ss-1]